MELLNRAMACTEPELALKGNPLIDIAMICIYIFKDSLYTSAWRIQTLFLYIPLQTMCFVFINRNLNVNNLLICYDSYCIYKLNFNNNFSSTSNSF